MWSDPVPFVTENYDAYFTFGSGTVHKSDLAHGGNYAAFMQGQGFDSEYNGSLHIGYPTDTGFEFPMDFSGRPDSLVFWSNYSIADGDQAAVVIMFLQDGIQVGNSNVVISGSSNGYQRLSSAIAYLTEDIPNQMGFAAYSTTPAVNDIMSYMYLDDITLIYNEGSGDFFPGGDFETWTDQSVTDPDGWVSSNAYSIPYASVTSSTDAASGLSARIESLPTIYFKSANLGYVILGDLNSSECGAGAIALDGSNLPIGVSGMYKYIPASGSLDSATIYLSYNYYDASAESCAIRLEWTTQLPPAAAWTSFNVSLPLELYWPWCFSPLFPEYFIVGFASTIINLNGNPSGPEGSVLFIDELSLVIDLCWPVIEHEKISFELYPNPTSDKLRLSNFSAGGACEIAIFNSLGKLMSSFKCNGIFKEIDISSFPEGHYFVRVSNGVESVGKAFVKTN